jgi:hypothetical protein
VFISIKTSRGAFNGNIVAVEISEASPAEILEVQPFVVAVLEAQKTRVVEPKRSPLPPQTTS